MSNPRQVGGALTAKGLFMRKRFLGIPVCLLVLGLGLVSCEAGSIAVRDAWRDDGGTGGRGPLVSSGIEITVTDLPSRATDWTMNLRRNFNPDGTEFDGSSVTESGEITGSTQTLFFANLTVGSYEIYGYLDFFDIVDNARVYNIMRFSIPMFNLEMYNVIPWAAFGYEEIIP